MTIPTHHFRAIWPIEDRDMTTAEAISEARDDLKAVGLRHGVRIAGEPRFQVRQGRDIPGSGGADLVVVADVRVVRMRDMEEAAA